MVAMHKNQKGIGEQGVMDTTEKTHRVALGRYCTVPDAAAGRCTSLCPCPARPSSSRARLRALKFAEFYQKQQKKKVYVYPREVSV